MALSPTSSRGTTFNGGTITGFLIVENDLFEVVLSSSAGRALLIASGNEVVMGVDGITAEVQIDPAQSGEFLIHGTGNIFKALAGPDTIGFFGHSPVGQQTGVAVDVAAIHAALVAFGLITA